MRKFLKYSFVSALIGSAVAGAAIAIFPLPGDIPVLMYHMIDTPERAALEKNVVSRQSFERQMGFLAAFKYHVLSMWEYEEIMSGRRQPRGRELLITFDDGNYTFDSNAFPILARHHLPVTLFLISGHLSGGIYGSMPTEVIKRLAEQPWITLASHSRSHPLLSQLTEDQMDSELAGSKSDLESFFNVPIRYLAYPSGDFDGRVMEAVQRAGYALAFTTSAKKLRGLSEGPLSHTRTKISRTADFLPVFWFKVSGLYERGKALLKNAKTRGITRS